MFDQFLDPTPVDLGDHRVEVLHPFWALLLRKIGGGVKSSERVQQ
jgi:hypothetical protein